MSQLPIDYDESIQEMELDDEEKIDEQNKEIDAIIATKKNTEELRNILLNQH